MTGLKVSLLPANLKRQSTRFRMWTVIALVLAIIAMIMLMVNILLSFYLRTPVNELQSLKSHNKNMTENVGRLAYVQEMFDQIENNNSLMANLKGNDPEWPFVIETATGNPAMYGISINRAEIVADGDVQGCVINAMTTDVNNISAWSENAVSQDNISNVVLGSITTKTENNGNVVFFFKADIEISNWNRE